MEDHGVPFFVVACCVTIFGIFDTARGIMYNECYKSAERTVIMEFGRGVNFNEVLTGDPNERPSIRQINDYFGRPIGA